jgi:hypothetical protein
MKPEMVRATLREIEAPGTGKRLTRRVVKPQPVHEWYGPQLYHPLKESHQGYQYPGKPVFGIFDGSGEWGIKCYYGKPGEVLWVRETFCPEHSAFMQETGNVFYRATDGDSLEYSHKWKPYIFMPRWASRITLEITDIRVERLQDISEEDAIAEGLHQCGDANPWVWVIEFTPYLINVDQLMKNYQETGAYHPDGLRRAVRQTAHQSGEIK